MSKAPLLEVDRITLESGKGDGSPLVHQVCFDVCQGETLGVIGESGSGKSLSCLAIMGLLPAGIRQTGGDIRMDGESLDGLNPQHMRRLRGGKIAMVLQNPASCFDSIFTIRQHFSETLLAHSRCEPKAVDQIAKEALAEVGFDDPEKILRLYPFQMSGGMLQRAMIALAVMMRVSLLIADEPTTDLDVASQARVLDLLAAIREKYRLSILLITHDLSVIARMADRVVVMKSGSVVETATVKALFDFPAHPYTQSIVRTHLSLYGETLTNLILFENTAVEDAGTHDA